MELFKISKQILFFIKISLYWFLISTIIQINQLITKFCNRDVQRSRFRNNFFLELYDHIKYRNTIAITEILSFV